MRPPLKIELSGGPYSDSGTHLRDELARVDLLVRAQVVRWRLTIGAAKPEKLWGMIHVSDTEIDQYLGAPVGSDSELPLSVLDQVQQYWGGETDARGSITAWIQATDSAVVLRLERLRHEFDLSQPEFDVVLLCLLPELDFRYRRIFGYLQDDASRSSLPIDLLGQMVHPNAPTLEEKRMIFEPGGNLLRWRLVYVAPEVEGRSGRAVRIDERIASFLAGSDDFDRRLDRVLRRVPPSFLTELFAEDSTIDALRNFAANAEFPFVVVLHGQPGGGRAKAASAACSSRGLPLLDFNVEAAVRLRGPAAWDELLQLAYREALLINGGLYVDGIDRLQTEDRPLHLVVDLTRIAENMSTFTFLAMESVGEIAQSPRLSRYMRFDFPPPHYDLRRTIWLALLPELADDVSRESAVEKLAEAFLLNEGQISQAIAAASALAMRRSLSNPKATLLELFEGCRRQAGRLVGFARRIEPTRGLTLDDVILAEPNKQQLRELLDRVRLRSRDEQESMLGPALSRSKGLVVLFAGSSGTGKTLAAEVVASQQGLDLYKIDASTVVSKWLGETEKNLGRVFADAEGSDALLFFDECDSLFGQRGEISEGRDRWANLQTNYLLQRIEEYSGVVILASNLRQNIDDAFLRRIQVIVEFPTPDGPLRFAIWKRSISPTASGLTDAELHEVADRFSVSGGSIRNVAIDASYRALAHNHTKIQLRDLIDAIAREYQKIGRPMTQGEFGERFYQWALADVIAPRPAG